MLKDNIKKCILIKNIYIIYLKIIDIIFFIKI